MPTGLIRRNGRYSTRRVVPLDLQATYGRREIVRALGTADPGDARKRHAEMWVQLDREFDDVRSKLNSTPNPVPFSLYSSLEEQEDMEAYLSQEEDMWEEERQRIASDPVLKAKSRLAKSLNAEADRLELAELARETEDEARPTRSGMPLTEVVERWAAEQKPTERTVIRTRNIVDRFQSVNGQLTVQAVTKRHVLAFKSALVDQGQTAANINVMLPMLGTVFNYAIDKLHLIQINPAARMRVSDKRRAKEKRRAFEEDELKRIFSSPVYSDARRPEAAGGEAAYWLPLLGLYTGARLTELGQLHPHDVAQETYRDAEGGEQSAWVIRIVENPERGQRVKNEGSERRVPVHSDLIALGFIRFAQAAQKAGQARLFPDIRPTAKGELMGNWSKWFGRYRRSLGIKGKDTPFHSFRHSFKHFARLASIPNDVHNEITGHETGDVADAYGGLSYPLAPLVDAMKRYRVPGFQLPKPPPAFRSAGAKSTRIGDSD